MKKILIIIGLFFAVQSAIGQALSQHFETLNFMYKVADSVLVEEVPNVSVEFLWTNTCLRMDIYSDTSNTTTPVFSLGIDIDTPWNITIDGDYFVFDNEIQEGLMYRIWFDRNKNQILQVVSINSFAQKAMQIR